MDNELKQMGKRLGELRTIMDVSVAEMARITGITEAEYIAHEAGEIDSSFTFIYRCAERLGVDMSALVTGDTPKLSFYNVTHAEEGGMPIRRRGGFEYLHLSPLLQDRQADPFLVTAPPQEEDNPIHLSTHAGQEFDYILKGRLKVQLEDKIEYMGPGDSIQYDSSRPHGMIAIGDEECQFLAVVIRSEGTAPELKFASNANVPSATDKLLYHNFMSETLDSEGMLSDVTFHYPDNFNFAFDVLDALAEKRPDQTGLLYVDKHRNTRHFSFAELARRSAQAANYLSSIGIRKGDRVMLVLKRHYQFWVVLNALHRIGAVAVPASNQLQVKDYVYRFQQGGIVGIVCTPDDGCADFVEIAAKECPEFKYKIMVNQPRAGWLDFDTEVERFSGFFERPADLKVTDPSIMFFSSGTSGYPKMVEHNFTYPLGHIITARWWHNIQPGGVHLTISDTGWGKALWGKIYGQWLCESTVLAYDFDRFDAADILTLFKEYQITTFCAPPTMYRFFIREDLSKYDLSSLKYANIAGEALNPEVFNQFYNATGIKLMEGFGQTETTMTIGNLVGMTPKPGSMGKPSPAYKVELVDPDGKPVEVGEVGEICIRTERDKTCGMFSRYYRNEEQTNESWHDGLYHTGDTAWKDEDGYYWYVGRTDDLIKSSGYRIGPFEVESVLMELPYVLECAVVGVPDEVRGQLVKAFIVLTPGKEGNDALVKEIQEYVKKHTAPYKYPRAVEFIDAMPKTISGKIKRNELRKR